MGDVVIPNRPGGSDPRSIAAILANFDAILAQLNGNVEAEANAKVAAAVTLDGNANAEGSSSSLARADHGHLIQGVERRAADPTAAHFVGRLYFNTTSERLRQCVDAAGVYVDVGPAAQDINATALELVANDATDDIYSKVIPAGLLGTSGMLRLTLLGDYLNNSGSLFQHTLGVTFGGVTLFNSALAGTIPTATGRRPWRLDLNLTNLGVTNAQHLNGRMVMGAGGAATGLGDAGGSKAWDFPFASADTNPAVDTTVAQTLTVNIGDDGTHANTRWRRKYACLELVTP